MEPMATLYQISWKVKVYHETMHLKVAEEGIKRATGMTTTTMIKFSSIQMNQNALLFAWKKGMESWLLQV